MIKLINGDCIEKLKELEDNSVDSIVTDPPYGLVSIQKRFGEENSAPAKYGKDGSFKRLSGGFMGKKWDGTGIENNVEMWAECLRVLKPGGHLLSFGGSRTYHRMACAIEDAGFEIRDQIMWVYGSGFPKSHNIGKAVDKLQGNEREEIEHKFPDGSKPRKTQHIDFYTEKERVKGGAKYTKGTSEWEGWGTALKPAHEPICLARKPLSEKTVAENCLKWKVGGININESRVGTEKISVHNAPKGTFAGGELNRGSDTESYREHTGRFPANLITDGSEEVRECFPETKATKPHGGDGGKLDTQEMGWGFRRMPCDLSDNGGNASRFFKSIIYQPKTSKSERNRGMDDLEAKPMYKADGSAQSLEIFGSTDGGREDRKNNHPTVKPIALMEYLIKMVTPKGGIVLDPFTGSGSTGVAAKELGFNFIGIEREEEYYKIAEARIDSVPKRLF